MMESASKLNGYTIKQRILRESFLYVLRDMAKSSVKFHIPVMLTMLDKSKKVHTISYDNERRCWMLDIDGFEKRFNPTAVTGIMEYINQFNPESLERFINDFYDNINI